MPKEVSGLLEDALSLPAEARAALAGSLIESLDNDLDESSEAAGREEIDRRIKQIDRGAVVVPWRRHSAALMPDSLGDAPLDSFSSCIALARSASSGLPADPGRVIGPILNYGLIGKLEESCCLLFQPSERDLNLRINVATVKRNVFLAQPLTQSRLEVAQVY